MSFNVPLREDERLDELFDGRVKIIQKKEGYRFSIDAILLAHFVSHLKVGSIVDLGTGSGIVPLILARKMCSSTIVGLEVQESLAEMAQRTMLLNGLSERVSILQQDLRTPYSHFSASSFDLVVSNPPYYPVGNGRINPLQQKAIARHEIMATLDDVIKGAHYLVKHTGLVTIIFPAKRLVDLLLSLKMWDLKPSRLQVVYSHVHNGGNLVIVESSKQGNPELKIEEPFLIYSEEGVYSRKMQKIYSEL